jgi:hypothetical protein
MESELSGLMNRVAKLTIICLACIGPIGLPGQASAQGADRELAEKAATSVAITSIFRCKDVKLTKAGEALAAEMKPIISTDHGAIVQAAQQAANREMKLMKLLGKKHCMSVKMRYPAYVEAVGGG